MIESNESECGRSWANAIWKSLEEQAQRFFDNNKNDNSKLTLWNARYKSAKKTNCFCYVFFRFTVSVSIDIRQLLWSWLPGAFAECQFVLKVANSWIEWPLQCIALDANFHLDSEQSVRKLPPCISFAAHSETISPDLRSPNGAMCTTARYCVAAAMWALNLNAEKSDSTSFDGLARYYKRVLIAQRRCVLPPVDDAHIGKHQTERLY